MVSLRSGTAPSKQEKPLHLQLAFCCRHRLFRLDAFGVVHVEAVAWQTEKKTVLEICLTVCFFGCQVVVVLEPWRHHK